MRVHPLRRLRHLVICSAHRRYLVEHQVWRHWGKCTAITASCCNGEDPEAGNTTCHSLLRSCRLTNKSNSCTSYLYLNISRIPNSGFWVNKLLAVVMTQLNKREKKTRNYLRASESRCRTAQQEKKTAQGPLTSSSNEFPGIQTIISKHRCSADSPRIVITVVRDVINEWYY